MRVLVFIAIAALAVSAHAEPPPGVDLGSPLHRWFEAQHSITGAWCCDVSDGYILADKDWRHAGGHYEVHILGKWYPIPETSLRNPAGGPNPTGSAIVWYRAFPDDDVRIFCFTPGFEY